MEGVRSWDGKCIVHACIVVGSQDLPMHAC